MNILITGGAGFIGSHVCHHLLEKGHKVIGLDNFDPLYSRKQKEHNLQPLLTQANFTFVEGDIRDLDLLKEVLNEHNIALVVHLAAKAGVRPSLKNPLEYTSVNVNGTVTVLEAMRQKGVEQLIFGSSSSVYGESTKVPFHEEDDLSNVISVYAASKQSAEKFTRMYHNLYKLDVINLRFFTVYGPALRPDLAIYKFVKANLTGEPLTIYGDGSMKRDYTYVGDIVEGIGGAIDRLQTKEHVYEIYNLGNEEPVSILELVEMIEKVTRKESNLKYQDAPPGDVTITYADISAAKSKLEYNPERSLKSGLEKFVQWFKKVV